MITTEQRYVVRLSIQAIATDPTDAVQDVLDQVLHGGLENFTYSVEEVGIDGKTFEVPTHRVRPDPLERAWGAQDNPEDAGFRGEFLG